MDDELFVINIDDTLNEVLGRLEHFAADQLPWAQALALYNVGFDARKDMAQALPRKFTIRSGKKPWAEKALFVHPRAPTDIKSDVISGKGGYIMVGTEDNLGKMLTDGGIKRHGQYMAKGGNRYSTMKTKDGRKFEAEFGVPVIGGGRKTAMTRIKPGRNSPRDVLEKGGFIIKTKDGRKLLIKPPAKYRKGIPKEQQHKVMFYMRPYVRIKPWWDGRAILARALYGWMPKRFEEACRKAMETRKRR